MELRKLGATGEELSVVGFGGILVMNEDANTASRLVSKAIDRGITYFDVAPSYGNAEERLGPALAPYRSSVFLSCKTLERGKHGAASELRQSLQRLQTDHIDLYQFHGINAIEDVQKIFSPGGAIEAFLEAREKGLIRYIGFSAHSESAALYMLEQFDFDTVMFPFNWLSWYANEFGQRVMDHALEKNMGFLCLKALAKRKLNPDESKSREKCWYMPVESEHEAKLAARFALSRPITAALSPGHEDLFEWLCNAADKNEPLTAEEANDLFAHTHGHIPLFPQV